MAQVVPAPATAAASQTLSLSAQLELAAAARAVHRAAARTTVRDRGVSFEFYDRRPALHARSAFRAAVAILQAELVR